MRVQFDLTQTVCGSKDFLCLRKPFNLSKTSSTPMSLRNADREDIPTETRCIVVSDMPGSLKPHRPPSTFRLLLVIQGADHSTISCIPSEVT